MRCTLAPCTITKSLIVRRTEMASRTKTRAAGYLSAPVLEKRPGLKRFILTGVKDTGTVIGRGSSATVVELDFNGLKCAGKKFSRAIYEQAAGMPGGQGGMLQRLETECAILSELKHPNVVQFLGFHLEAPSELPLLVMEFLPTTLSDCITRSYGRLPEEISYSILDDVATALCYLHGRDPPLIHGNLSAQNVLLTTDMRAKVADLGVSTILNSSPSLILHLALYVPPPSHLPPEVVMSEERPTYTAKMDSFSYGVLVLHVLCGRNPVPGSPFRHSCSRQSVLLSEVERREEYFVTLDPNHPLRLLIKQCLSNDPSVRPNVEEIFCQVRKVRDEHLPPSEDRRALLGQEKKP